MIQYLLKGFASWFTAIALGLLPILSALVVSPSKLGRLTELPAYIASYHELNFTIIAVLCIALVDNVEIVVTNQVNGWTRIFSVFLLAFYFVTGFLCSGWALLGNSANTDDVRNLAWILLVVIICSAVQRLMLIFGVGDE